MLNTVNVIKVADLITYDIEWLKAFTNDKKGREEAEALFINTIKENDPEVEEDDLKWALEDGYFEIDNGRVVLFCSGTK